ncbi:MAG: TIGR03751 family conjugal transfer lipoprotein [Gammaproteobacteria bacterium]|nr:MAG: TIGR03751 family conjugal transfer lipoprotein [Gammaproteobacteria bacterium]PIE37489.1 MAG: TIGR03751 family conjugal transfer lipoprotein [Gammaproteobacteria bacterium]
MRISIDLRPRRGVVLPLVLAFGVCSLAACAHSPKQVIRQGEGPTVVEILQGTGGDVAESETARHTEQDIVRRPGTTSAGHAGYARTALNETRQLFPVLPNPTILLYVHPHLATSEQMPVPGYTTAYSLYERQQYALPGELPPANIPVTDAFPPAHDRDSGAPFMDLRSP